MSLYGSSEKGRKEDSEKKREKRGGDRPGTLDAGNKSGDPMQKVEFDADDKASP